MLSVVVFIVALVDTEAFTQEQWKNTVHAAEDQPFLGQRMSKEFLMIVAGHNVSLHSKLLVDSIISYDNHLKDLINGVPAKGILSQKDMGPMVEAAMQAAVNLWVPFRTLMSDNVATSVAAADFGDSCANDPELDLCDSPTGGRRLNVVAKSVLRQFAEQSRALLTASVAVVDTIVVMEKANGAKAEPVVVQIARRQTMIMQKMCKEVLLVGLGVDVKHNLHELHLSEVLLDGANKGIILGAPWAGVPTLTKYCTLDEMKKVTTKWAVCKPYVDEVLGAEATSLQAAEAVAKQRAYNVVKTGDDLEHEMEEAVKLFKHDNGTCTIASAIKTDDWKYLLNSVDYQRYYGQLLALQVVQVANGVEVQASKVQLTINMATAYSGLRTLIEGNSKHSSPPSQAIADELILVYKTWQEISLEFDTVIYTNVVPPILVEKVIRLGAVLLHEMDEVMKLYLIEVGIADKSVDAYVITTAGRQRMYLEELALAANEIKFYVDHDIDTKHAMDLLKKTRDSWLTTHWALLQGDPVNNVSETTNLCIIKKMKEVKDQFDLLKDAAWKVADVDSSKVADKSKVGDYKTDQIKEMIRVLPIAQEAMSTAVDYYTNGVKTCPEIEPTLVEWQAGLVAVGTSRTSSQKTCTDYLWGAQKVPGLNPGMAISNFWGADGTIGEGMVLAITKLRFGWGADSIPAPYNDKLREDIAKVSVVVNHFSKALVGNSSAVVATDSISMLKAAEVLVSHYKDYALAAYPNMPVNRIELSTRLEMLANKMLKEALLIRAQSSRRLRTDKQVRTLQSWTSHADMMNTMGAYAEVVRMLKEGNEALGVPRVMYAGREDIENQQARVEVAYTAFSNHVQCVSKPACVNTQDTKKSLDALETEIHAATKLYFLADPFIPEQFPWTMVIFIVLAVFVCGVIGFGCYYGLKKAKS